MVRFYQAVFDVSRSRKWQVAAATIIGAAATFFLALKGRGKDLPMAALVALGAGMGFVSSVLLVLKDATSQWWSARRASPTIIDRLLLVGLSFGLVVATLILVIAVVIVMLAFIDAGKRR